MQVGPATRFCAQFSMSLLSPHLTNEETKAQRLSNPPRPQLPNAKSGFTHRQPGSREWAPNRTFLVLEALALHPLREQSFQDEPGGDSTTHLEPGHGLGPRLRSSYLSRPRPPGVTHRAALRASQPQLSSLSRTSPRPSVHSTRSPQPDI